MKIGLVGKPNVGKSTFFAAMTMAEAAIGNYPFTTIKPNVGVAHVRVPDPGPDLGVQSTPRTGRVVGGTRYVPVEVVDVAGLVPGAHEGRGLGNQFLNDLARADALVHIVDASGATDAEGNPTAVGGRDPLLDVAFLEEELDRWFLGHLKDGWERVARRVQQEGRKLEAALTEKLTGIGVSEGRVVAALRETGLAGHKPAELDDEGLLRLSVALRKANKPLVVCLNKADMAPPAALERLRQALPTAVVASAQAELALMKGAAAGLVDYVPGAGAFAVKGTITAAQTKGLDYVRDHVLVPFGQTGVNRALEAAVFDVLGLVPVFPVEDETKLTDKDGRVLPDCHLVPEDTTARQLAGRVHTDLAEHFIRAIDCRKHRAVAADHELEAGDIIKIVAKA